MTTSQLKQSMLTSRFWTFLAIFWIIRGVKLVMTGADRSYIWLKHGFPLGELSAIGEVRYANWVKLVCFIMGIVILVQQHRHKKAQDAQSSDLTV